MSARGMFTVVGSAMGGLIGWPGTEVPSADPASLRELFADLGMVVGQTDQDLESAVRRFQARVGLPVDGVAGPRTVHRLARVARDARDLQRFERSVA
jgi:peptidoglycan hydrolase-like protein with peptidoglycan-binding domain